MTETPISEHALQSSFFAVLEINKRKFPQLSMVRAIPNGGKRHITTAVKLKREGVAAGTPDVCVFIPSNGYHGAFIEFKRPKGKLTPAQTDFMQKASFSGYSCKVAFSADEGLEFLEKYLGIVLQK